MCTKRIVSIIVVIVGVAMMFTAHYIRQKVSEGKGQVSSAQKNVDTANSLFSSNKATKQIGQGITSPVQKKIDAGKGEISEYEKLATALQIGGIIFIIGGGGALVLGRKKSR